MNEKIMTVLGGLAACVVGFVILYLTLGMDSAMFDWLRDLF